MKKHPVLSAAGLISSQRLLVVIGSDSSSFCYWCAKICPSPQTVQFLLFEMAQRRRTQWMCLHYFSDLFWFLQIILFWELQMNWCLPFVSSGPSASVAAPPDLEREEDNVRTVSTIMSLACCCHGAQQKYCHYAKWLHIWARGQRKSQFLELCHSVAGVTEQKYCTGFD